MCKKIYTDVDKNLRIHGLYYLFPEMRKDGFVGIG